MTTFALMPTKPLSLFVSIFIFAVLLGMTSLVIEKKSTKQGVITGLTLFIFAMQQA
jgi:hypothetical protein